MAEFKKPKLGESELRAMLKRKAKVLSKVIISKHCRQIFLQQAQHYGWIWHQLEGLAALKKKRDPRYLRYCEGFLAHFAEAEVGHLPELPPDALPPLEKLFDVLLAVMAGKQPPEYTGSEFATLTKRLFVPPKTPGPHPELKYDVAFVRRMKGERLSEIIKGLEPEAYARDPYATTQRYSASIRLRKKRAARI